ncbi:hypothetical protein F2P81_011326 [Scophthalmus maximus]|uniref:Small ribosomal subunit protein eS21 n=1 Tax=Scophthalmus maximus TaxID=52904 RepID=A0A6A4SY86_SCOMX|nr:hypothetical protein F2P81_011326 [Scophthalmus maximus]
MQNDAGEFVDLYVPRKCSASNRIIGAKDHASIQINIAEVDKVTGRFNGQFKTYAICGAIRRMGESDDSILRLARDDTVVANYLHTDATSTMIWDCAPTHVAGVMTESSECALQLRPSVASLPVHGKITSR